MTQRYLGDWLDEALITIACSFSATPPTTPTSA